MPETPRSLLGSTPTGPASTSARYMVTAPGWHDAIGWLARTLGSRPEVERLVLFGSRARGDHRPRSDIDLAIACPLSDRDGWVRLTDLADRAPTLLAIDLVRLEEAPFDLRRTIEAEGIVLVERG